MEKKYGKRSIKECEARGDELFREVGSEYSRFPEFRRIQIFQKKSISRLRLFYVLMRMMRSTQKMVF